VKVYAYVALAVVLLGGLKYGYSAVYDSGFNAAIVEQEKAIQIAKDEAIELARVEWEATAEIAEAEIIIEERIVEVVRTVEKEIPKIVERIVEVTPECNDLGADFAGLLNKQVRAGAGDSVPSSDAAADANP
jgi:hypothetical protein